MPRLVRQSVRIFLVVSALGHPGEVSSSIRITVTSGWCGGRFCVRGSFDLVQDGAVTLGGVRRSLPGQVLRVGDTPTDPRRVRSAGAAFSANPLNHPGAAYRRPTPR